MNRLLTPNGGARLHGGDFQFMQEATLEAFKGALHLYSKPYDGTMFLSAFDYYLDGNNDYVFPPAYVMLNYEICYFHGAILAGNVSFGSISLRLSENYDPAGLDVFADGQSRNTYQLRRAVIGSPLLGGSAVELRVEADSHKTLAKALAAPLRQTIDQYALVGPSLNTPWQGAVSTVMAIRQFDRVTLQGYLAPPFGNFRISPVCTMPAGWRPNINATDFRSFRIANSITAEPAEHLEARIYGNGEIRFHETQNSTPVTGRIHLDGIQYHTLIP